MAWLSFLVSYEFQEFEESNEDLTSESIGLSFLFEILCIFLILGRHTWEIEDDELKDSIEDKAGKGDCYGNSVELGILLKLKIEVG